MAERASSREQRRPGDDFRSEVKPVEISLGCDELPALAATGSALSVFAVLWVRRSPESRWQEHGRTETVRSDSAPQFARSFFVDYLDHDDVLRNDEYDTFLRIELFQHTSAAVSSLEKQKRCGWVEITLRELYRTPVKRVALPLRTTRSSAIRHGVLQLRIADATRVDALQPFVELNLSAESVVKQVRKASAGGGRGGPTGEYFVSAHRWHSGGTFELFYRTERVRLLNRAAGPSLRFERFKQSLQRCCNGQPDNFLRLELWQEDKLGWHQLLGAVETSLSELLESQHSDKDRDGGAVARGTSEREEGRRRRRAATPGSDAAVPCARYELKPPKPARDDGPAWVPGSMGALPLAKEAALQSAGTLLVSAELFSSATPQLNGSEALGDSEAELATTKRKGKKRLGKKPPRAKSRSGLSGATASAEFGGDMEFLKELLGDSVVNESDVKEIVGDGIRYLHERHNRHAKQPSSRAQSGPGNFLDGSDRKSRSSQPVARPTKASAGHAMSLLRHATTEHTGSPSEPSPASRKKNRKKQRRRPRSSPVRDGLEGALPPRPASEGCVLPAIGGLHARQTRLAQAQEKAREKHMQRRAKQAQADSRRSEQRGDPAMWSTGLRSDEASRARTAGTGSPAAGRFVMKPPKSGVYTPQKKGCEDELADEVRQSRRPRRQRPGLVERPVNTEGPPMPRRAAQKQSRAARRAEALEAAAEEAQYEDDEDWAEASSPVWQVRRRIIAGLHSSKSASNGVRTGAHGEPSAGSVNTAPAPCQGPRDDAGHGYGWHRQDPGGRHPRAVQLAWSGVVCVRICSLLRTRI